MWKLSCEVEGPLKCKLSKTLIVSTLVGLDWQLTVPEVGRWTKYQLLNYQKYFSWRLRRGKIGHIIVPSVWCSFFTWKNILVLPQLPNYFSFVTFSFPCVKQLKWEHFESFIEIQRSVTRILEEVQNTNHWSLPEMLWKQEKALKSLCRYLRALLWRWSYRSLSQPIITIGLIPDAGPSRAGGERGA